MDVGPAGAPMIDGATAATIGTPYVLNLSSPGTSDISRWTIRWGDGTVETIAGNPGSAAHRYVSAGNYAIEATASTASGELGALTVAETPQVTLLADMSSGTSTSFPRPRWMLDDKLYLSTSDDVLWQTDGAPAGTSPFQDGYTDSDPYLTTVHGIAYFGSYALWATDGTPSGTRVVADVRPSAYLRTIGSDFYFLGNRDASWGLWKSDGTAEGTVRIREFRDVNPLRGSDSYFLADDSVHGYQVWTTDGTASGTIRLTNISLAVQRAYFSFFETVGNFSYFDLSAYATSVWRTDGTVSGTGRVIDAATGEPLRLTAPRYVTTVGRQLYLMHDYPGYHDGQELWRIDTTTGLAVLLTINRQGPARLSFLGSVGNELYFAGNSGQGRGVELWRTDGTPAGTTLVRDIRPGHLSSAPQMFTTAGRIVYFTAEDGVHGRELWRTDGTAQGTFLVTDLNPGPAGSNPAYVGTIGDRIYFGADDGQRGFALWNITQGDRVEWVGPIAPSRDPVYPAYLGSLGDKLILSANDGVHGNEPWSVSWQHGTELQVTVADAPTVSRTAAGDLVVNGTAADDALQLLGVGRSAVHVFAGSSDLGVFTLWPG